MRGLKDKVAIVAGAAPGNIGGATAVRLAEEGMAVVAADLNEAAAQSVVDEIRGFGSRAASRPFDPSLFTPMPPELAVDGVTLVRSGLVNEETQPGPFLTTFTTAGDYPYFSAIHIGVTGVVHVGTPSAESDTPADAFERMTRTAEPTAS